jgi:hypothetical protein
MLFCLQKVGRLYDSPGTDDGDLYPLMINRSVTRKSHVLVIVAAPPPFVKVPVTRLFHVTGNLNVP